MRVAILAEFYPRHDDPVLGIWTHRQALAVRAKGVDVEVFVLHRLVPPARDFRPRALRALLAQPRRTTLDGLAVRYVRYFSPPRAQTYAQWGAWAAPALAAAMRGRRRYDLIHAHNGVPAGDAARRVLRRTPLVVSVHGGDVLWTNQRVPGGARAVRRALSAARLVLANSAGIAQLARGAGARETRVVHLGSDVPEPVARSSTPSIATVAHLVERKRHEDVLRALGELPGVRYLIVGDGPQREPLEALAAQLGVADRVEFAGALAPDAALLRARRAWCFAMPSVAEAFGVAYIEAMAAGIPAIGCAGEPGPGEIAAAGGGIELVPPRDPRSLARAIRSLLYDEPHRSEQSRAAANTVREHFTWERCGAATLSAYREALTR
jgi:teichuronic acid biosynthesis glycosyltransferase TuaC